MSNDDYICKCCRPIRVDRATFGLAIFNIISAWAFPPLKAYYNSQLGLAEEWQEVDEEHKWREEVHKRRFMVFVILPNVIATITNLLVICGYLRRNAYFYLPQIISLLVQIVILVLFFFGIIPFLLRDYIHEGMGWKEFFFFTALTAAFLSIILIHVWLYNLYFRAYRYLKEERAMAKAVHRSANDWVVP